MVLVTLAGAVSVCRLSHAESIEIGLERLEYAPYYTTMEEPLRGAAIDLLQRFEQLTPYTVSFNVLPVARLLTSQLQRKVLYKFPANPTWAQNAKESHTIYYSDPVFQYTDGTLIKVENQGKEMRSIGVVRGFTPWDYLSDIEMKKLNLVEGPTLSGMIKMLNAGRIDGLYCNIKVAEQLLTEVLGDKHEIIFESNLPHTTSFYYLSSSGDARLIELFNVYLQQDQSFIEALKAQYGIH